MKKNVAEPDQVTVDGPDHHQPETAPVPDAAVIDAFRLGPTGHHHETGAKQHGKHGQEFLVEENMGEKPGTRNRHTMNIDA